MNTNDNIVKGSLIAIPSTDGNFLSALKRATKEQLLEAINIMESRNGKDKSRIAACNRELKRRIKKGDSHEV